MQPTFDHLPFRAHEKVLHIMQNERQLQRRPRRPSAGIASVLAIACSLGACAANPETIEPVPVGVARYQGQQCAELGRTMSELDEKLAILSTQQRTKRVNDVVGWIFLAEPTASIMTADIRPQIALHKGERDAVERAMAARCARGGYRS